MRVKDDAEAEIFEVGEAFGVRAVSETLTDNSVVWNCLLGNETIAWQAEECARDISRAIWKATR